MYRACIVIVDATRARLFMFERSAEPDGTHEELREQLDFANPAGHHRPAELFGDHRDAHMAQIDAGFARTLVAELGRALDAVPVKRLIVCAAPAMLGDLRSAGIPHRDGMVVDEVPRDLVKLTTSEIRNQLESYGLLPPRPPRPGLARGM